jgi:adenosyl cobinamide kinase/adenosyl cobinamide phosphate guanylyltransferase
MDKRERLWREAVGRCCQRIAAQAQQVIRVVCGLSQVLK